MYYKSRAAIIIIIVLVVLLAFAIGYIVFDKYSKYQLDTQMSAYQTGIQAGYQQAIVQLINNAVTCQQVPVTYNNQTINLIAVECLKLAQQSEQGQQATTP